MAIVWLLFAAATTMERLCHTASESAVRKCVYHWFREGTLRVVARTGVIGTQFVGIEVIRNIRHTDKSHSNGAGVTDGMMAHYRRRYIDRDWWKLWPQKCRSSGLVVFFGTLFVGLPDCGLKERCRMERTLDEGRFVRRNIRHVSEYSKMTKIHVCVLTASNNEMRNDPCGVYAVYGTQMQSSSERGSSFCRDTN